MTWPFGGLPLGGVFLGQADGPVLGVARLGGPLALTAAVYLGGVGVGALAEAGIRAVRDGARARTFARADPEVGAGPSTEPDPDRGPDPGSAGRGPLRLLSDAVAGLGTLALVGTVAVISLVAVSIAADARAGRGAVHRHGDHRRRARGRCPWVPQVPDQPERRAGRADVSHPSARAGRPRRRTRNWCSGPRTWCPSTPRCPSPPSESVLSGLARTLHTTLVVGVTETISTTQFRNEIVAWGPDGTLVLAFEKVHRVPFGEYVPYRSFFAHLGNLSSVPLDAVPGTGTGLAAHTGGTARGDGLLRGLLRRPGPLLGARRRPTADRPHQHLVLRHRPGSDPGDRRLRGTGRPTGPRPAPGRADRVQRGDHQPRRAARTAPCSGHARSSWPPSPVGTGRTLYVDYGDLPVLVLAALALIAGWLLAGRGGRRPRRPRRDRPGPVARTHRS